MEPICKKMRKLFSNKSKESLIEISHRSEKISVVWKGTRMDFEVKPLQKFVTAKKCVTKLLNELNTYINDVEKFIVSCGKCINDNEFLKLIEAKHNIKNVESNYFQNLLQSYKEQVNSILEVSVRDTMKVAFFGRTSNGKSTVINALLNDKILPSGIGHTTSCFVSMHGSNESEPYILVDKCNEKKSVSNLKQLASALNDNRLDPSSLVQLYWPTEKCPILSNEVVFIDSPGVDVSPDLDLWIEKYCRDADVFVLVTNAESTLNNSEKKFFHRVNKCVSRPNIFILNNRWDASALEPDDIDAVRSQHMERGVDFLVNELKCSSKNDAQQRIFFVSAREALQSRISENNSSYDSRSNTSSITNGDTFQQNMPHLFGYHDRIIEFNKFEHIFQKSLSKSAITTKFKTRSDRALNIIADISSHLETIQTYIQQTKEKSLKKLDALKMTRDQQENIRHQAVELIEKQIQETENDIFTMICSNLNSECSHVGKIVNTFHYPFYDNPLLLDQYKKELVTHVENGLEHVMIQRCNQDVFLMIATVQNSILSFVHNVIDKNKISEINCDNDNIDISIQSSLDCINAPYKMNFNFPLYISALSQDFNGDIKFRFSLSPSAILSWVISLYNPNISDSLFPTSLPRRKFSKNDFDIINNGGSVTSCSTNQKQNNTLSQNPNDRTTPKSNNHSIVGNTLSNSNGTIHRSNTIDDTGVNPAILHAVGLMTSTTSGLLLISLGMAWKFIGPRFIAAIAGIYSSVYVYERISWTDAAKEKSYKRQFSNYVGKRLKKSIQMVALEFSKMSSKELRSKLKEGRIIIDKSIQKSDYEISKLNKQINELKILENQIQNLNKYSIEFQQRLQHFQFEYSLA